MLQNGHILLFAFCSMFNITLMAAQETVEDKLDAFLRLVCVSRSNSEASFLALTSIY